MSDFKVIESRSKDEFTSKLNQAVEEGYSLAGDMIVTPDRTITRIENAGVVRKESVEGYTYSILVTK